MMSDHTKRTRSQLALPEEFRDVHFGISPLRAAKQERRRNLQTNLSVGSHASDEGQSDDELLLSPPKIPPQKRAHLSQEPEHPPERGFEGRFKRFKKNHDDDQSQDSEMKQPSGPFDFSVIGPEELFLSINFGKPGSSSKKRAQTVPLVSPSMPPRDFGKLMPSPRKTYLIPPSREVLRFSSLPRTFQPLADAMAVDDVTEPSRVSGRDKSPTKLPSQPPTSPPEGLEISLCEVLATEGNQLPPVASALEVIASEVSSAIPPLSLDVGAMTPKASPKDPDNDGTPRPVNVLPTFALNTNPNPIAPNPPLLSDDPPSPLSTLSSLSDIDYSPSLHGENHNSNVEPLGGTLRATQAPSPAPPCDIAACSIALQPQVTRLPTSITSGGRGRRGFVRLPGSARLTRSASIKKQKEAGSVGSDTNAQRQDIDAGPSGSSSVVTTESSDSSALPPPFLKTSSSSVSHKATFSFAMPTSSSMNKTVEKVPASPPQKPWSLPKRQPSKLPSPKKPASSLGLGDPPLKHTGLSNLSIALEKLKIPPPPRPATTLGFNRDAHSSSNLLDSKNAFKAKDDSIIRLGNGSLPSAKGTATPLRRVVTVGAIASREPNAHASGSKPAAVIAGPSTQPSDAGPPAKKINVHSGVIVGKNSFSKPRGLMFAGVGKKRPFEKVSKKSSLPVVEGSPVKDTSSARAINWDGPSLPSASEMLTAALPLHGDEVAPPQVFADVEQMKLEDPFAVHGTVLGADAEVGQVEPLDARKHARRASLASQFLQQTLAVLPSTPPSVPKGSDSKSKAAERPQFSSQRTRSGLRSDSHSDVASSRNYPPKGHEAGAYVSRSGSIVAASPSLKPSSLKVLKKCTIFVDVRTDDGDEAGGLFVDMLRGLGAKIIGRAGQSCTHIVYKNGLMSTLTKYRLMREPKPFVVGISWVVECAEQCRRIAEDGFLVDLEGLNVAGNNKRRRSMLPKHISSTMQTHATGRPPVPGPSLTGTLTSDQSMDGSSGADRSMNSSDGRVEDEDDLPPLERARQRRNIFFKR